MSKLRKKLGKRIMAVALSVAMIMSNMTVYASEVSEVESQIEEVAVNEDEETVDEEIKTADEDAEAADKDSSPKNDAESDNNDEDQEIVEETKVKDNEKSTETKSSLRVEKEEKEKTDSNVDNKAVTDPIEDKKEYTLYNQAGNGKTVNLKDAFGNFEFDGFGNEITNDHGPQSAQENATITFTVPGSGSDKVDIEVVMCQYGNGTVTAEVDSTPVAADKITNVVMSDKKEESNSKKYTISEVAGGSTVKLIIPENGAYVHSIKATVQKEVVTPPVTSTVADNTTINFSELAGKKTDGSTLDYQGTVGNETTSTKLAVDGFAFTNFTWHGDSHGIAENGTITLNLESGKRAIITVTGCGYSNSNPKVTTDSGTVLPETETSSILTGDDKFAPVYTIAGAEGQTTLTFTGNHYLHELSVKYMAADEYVVAVSAGENGKASASVSDVSVVSATAGATVTLTATPDSDAYGLDEWQVIKPEGENALPITTGDNANVATFTMPAEDVAVKAVFKAVGAEHSITVTENVEHGTVTKGSVAAATTGVTVQMDDVATATPDDGYILNGWDVTYTEGETTQKVTVTKTSGKYSFEMPNADVTVTPVIEEKQVTYFTTTYFNQKFIGTGTASNPEHKQNDPVDDIDGLEVLQATVKYNDKDHGLAVSGGKVKLTLTPEKKYDITIWGCQHGSSASIDASSKGEDLTVTPQQADNTDDPLKTEVNQANVKKFTILNVQDEVTLTFSSGQAYVHGIILTESSGAEKYTITVTDDGHGSVKADNALAEADTEITLTATPDAHYQFKEWQVVSGDVTIENDKFKMPAKNVEIKAIFEPIIRRDWDFANDENLKGEKGAKVTNKTETVADLNIDATGSEWDSTGTGTNGAVAKDKTKITVSVEGICKVKVSAASADYTVDGNAATEAVETFDCEGTDGKVVIEMTADNYIKAINVTPVYYVAAGTYNFATMKDLKIDGFTFNSIEHKGNTHGCETTDAEASMTLNLSSNANVTVTGCRYGVGSAVEMTATSGKPSKAIISAESADNVPEFTVRKADAGELTLTFTMSGTFWIHSVNIEYLGEEVPDVYSDGIDVWDFGAEQLKSTDAVKYNNILTEDIINSWYPDVAAGKDGVTITSFEVKDEAGNVDFMFNDGGYAGTHRLRTTNENITRYDSKSLTIGDTTYSGYLYSNKSSEKGVYVGVRLNVGDVMTAVVSSNSNAYTVTVEDPEGGTQDFARPSGPSIITYYATKSGIHKIYNGTDEKLVVARVTRQHNQKVKVSGNVTLPRGASEDLFTLSFICKESGMEEKAQIKDGKYEVELYENYHYDVIVAPTTYVISEGAELTLGAANSTLTAEHNIVVEGVTLFNMSGSIKGLEEDAAAQAALKISLVKPEDKLYQPEIAIADDMTYEVALESGVTYELVTEGINDYQLDSTVINNSDVIKITAETKYRNIIYVKKPVYKVTIEPEGATLANLADAKFTFTNLNEEGYVYTFTGPNNIELRDGTYTVVVTDSGAYRQKLTSNLVVNGSDVTKKIAFDSTPVTKWDFLNANSYENNIVKNPCDGLIYTGNGTWKYHGDTYGSAAGNVVISVPVSGSGKVAVTVGYQWDISSGDVQDVLTGKDENGNNKDGGQDHVIEIPYTSASNTVDITVGATSYIKTIEVKAASNVEYKETITVGKDKDYETINDALAAVRNMARTEDNKTKLVTIEIDPGNYEEMLVIDVENIKLVNAAGSNASIELRNKGVDIDPNAVRITSYYGHGYSYYSMGNDCKWNEEVLAVNKANGYESYTNPGSGSTNGSYWNATVVINASNVSAEGIIFENSFNQYISKKAADDVIVKQSSAKEGAVPRASMAYGDTTVQNKSYVERAAALAITNGQSQISFDNCKFIGRQDTLYGGTGVTAAFYGCSVYGGTDYIMGPMAAVFAKCDLVFNTSEDNNDVGYITAAQQSSGRGYLMYNCHVTSTVPGVDTASKYTSKPGYLGRPWQAHTGEAVFYKTIIDEVDTHWQDYYGNLADDHKDKILSGKSLIAAIGWDKSLSDVSELSQEYGTYEVSGVDNSKKRADWAKVLEEEKLVSGDEITVKTFLGDWNAFAGKDMTVVMPNDQDVSAPAAPKVIVTPQPSDDDKVVVGAEIAISAEAGAKVYYSVNSADELTAQNGTPYTGSFKVEDTTDHKLTIKAIAQKYGKTSEVTTVEYTITEAAKPVEPEISVTPAAVNGDIKVGSRIVISSAPGADIYYNVNSEDTPNTSSVKYTAGKAGIEITNAMVAADSTITVKAIASQYGKTSDVATFTAEVTVIAPTANYKSGFQFSDGGGTVKLTSDNEDAIYYTISTDETEPADPTLEASNPITYDAAEGIKITSDTKIKAVAKKGNKYSEVTSLSYVVNLDAPTADPVSGTKFNKTGGKVKLNAAEGATIYYTMGTNPSNPIEDTENRETYDKASDGISVSGNVMINAVAEKDGRFSAVANFIYEVTVGFDEKPSLTSTGDLNSPKKGDVLTVSYKLDTEGTDASSIMWYRVSEDSEKPLNITAKEYTVTEEDAGSYIEVQVTPNVEGGTAGIPETAKSGTVQAESKPPVVNPNDPSDIVIDETEGVGIEIVGLAEKYDYTGAAITPDFEVVDNNIKDKESGAARVLALGTDYTVKYSNNKKAGETATVTVIGKGNYAGKEVTGSFRIEEAKTATVKDEELLDLKGAKITTKFAPQPYTGKAQYPEFELTPKGGSAVTYEYVGNKYVKKVENAGNTEERIADVNVAVSNNINKGTATILVTGKKDGNKTTSVKATFKITPVDLSTATVSFVGEETGKDFKAPYAVKGATPAVTVSYKFEGATEATVLKAGKDYTVKYSANKKADATGKVVITGKGNYTKKAPEKTFTVDKLDMKDTRLVAVDAYEGAKAAKLKAVVVDANGDALKAAQYTVKVYADNEGKTEYAGDEKGKCKKGDTIYVQVEAKDDKNLVAGSKTTGLLAVTVGDNIAKAKIKVNVKSKAYTGAEVKLDAADLTVTLNGNSVDPKPEDETKMEAGKGYYEIVSYSNNINKGTATAVIKGVGACSGTKTIKFKIAAKEMKKHTKAPAPTN